MRAECHSMVQLRIQQSRESIEEAETLLHSSLNKQ